MRLFLLIFTLTLLVGESIAQAVPQTQPVSLGSHASKPDEGQIEGRSGAQFAFFVKNKKRATLGMIRSVSFFIGKNGTPQTPFQVHIYQASRDVGQPGHDLLARPVVASASKGGQWYTVDLTAHNLSVPQEGFFVAMEWLPERDTLHARPLVDLNGSPGQLLCPTFEFKESFTWSYTVGIGWKLLTLANNQGRRYNAMIKTEVDMIK